MPVYEPVTGAELFRYHGPAPGTKALSDVVLFTYFQHGVRSGGIYNRRKQRSGSAWSLHSVGRAADFMVTSSDIGNWLGHHLVNTAELIGCCEVIFEDWRWTGDRGFHTYTRGGHDDHVHCGQTREVARSKSSIEELHHWFGNALFPQA